MKLNLDKAKEILTLLQEDTITPQQVRDFVTLLVNLNKEQKEELDNSFNEISNTFSKNAYTKIQEALGIISQKHADALLEVRQLTNKQKKAHEDMMGKCVSLIEEINSS